MASNQSPIMNFLSALFSFVFLISGVITIARPDIVLNGLGLEYPKIIEFASYLWKLPDMSDLKSDKLARQPIDPLIRTIGVRNVCIGTTLLVAVVEMSSTGLGLLILLASVTIAADLWTQLPGEPMTLQPQMILWLIWLASGLGLAFAFIISQVSRRSSSQGIATFSTPRKAAIPGTSEASQVNDGSKIPRHVAIESNPSPLHPVSPPSDSSQRSADQDHPVIIERQDGLSGDTLCSNSSSCYSMAVPPQDRILHRRSAVDVPTPCRTQENPAPNSDAAASTFSSMDFQQKLEKTSKGRRFSVLTGDLHPREWDLEDFSHEWSVKNGRHSVQQEHVNN